MAYTTIDNPFKYFNTVLYTGDGSSSRSITGVGFAPDWIWVKERSSTSQHQLVDKVRGSDRRLQSDTSDSEDTDTSPFVDFKSLDSDGWSMGDGGAINENSQTYVAWNWLGGGSASSNSDGSITSSVSANTTSGFSIVSYTGDGTNNNTATIGHGLGVAPSMIIVKGRNATASWITTNTANDFNNVLELNTTAANSANTYAFGTTGIPPTSTVFTVAAESGQHHTNTNNNTYIAYCFAEKKGYSKFGTYTGNGNADGTFIYTGFKPAFVIVKRASATKNWYMWDNKRDTSNDGATSQLYPNLSASADNGSYVDLLSNGFKLRNSSNGNDADSHIYMAFAEAPFVTAGTKAAGTAR